MLISVILPVYNGAKFIKECIASVLNQSYENIELVIVDDGSTDNSIECIESFNDPRIKLYKNDCNLGLVHSLNNAIKYSKGILIARIDQDDVMISERLALQVGFLTKYPNIGVIGSNFSAIDSAGIFKYKSKLPGSSNRIDMNIVLHGDPSVGHPFVLTWRKYIDLVGGYNEAYNKSSMEDVDLWFRMRQKGVVFSNLEQCLTKYRIHEAQMTKNKTSLMSIHYEESLANFIASIMASKKYPGSTASIIRQTYVNSSIIDSMKNYWGACLAQLSIYRHLSHNSEIFFIKSAMGYIEISAHMMVRCLKHIIKNFLSINLL